MIYRVNLNNFCNRRVPCIIQQELTELIEVIWWRSRIVLSEIWNLGGNTFSFNEIKSNESLDNSFKRKKEVKIERIKLDINSYWYCFYFFVLNKLSLFFSFRCLSFMIFFRFTITLINDVLQRGHSNFIYTFDLVIWIWIDN